MTVTTERCTSRTVSLVSMSNARVARQRLRRLEAERPTAPSGNDLPGMPDRSRLAGDRQTPAVPDEAPPDRAIAQADEGAQGYLNQIVRYFPTELVGLYIAFLAVLEPATAQGPQSDFTTHWIAFAVFAALAPLLTLLIYAGRVRQTGEKFEWPLFELVVASLSFAAWASALPQSPFLDFGWWKGGYGAFAAGLIVIFVPLLANAFGLSLRSIGAEDETSTK